MPLYFALRKRKQRWQQRNRPSHISQLTETIAGREILTPCDLAIAPGEICAIIGPSGTEKTTLFKTIVGLAFPIREPSPPPAHTALGLRFDLGMG